jgi:DNA repair ATPase RecN
MTNSNVNVPVVKNSHPELYAEHTFHMSKARKYTYNYVVIDEVIRELWGEMTMEEMAEALNEYPNRIKYRVQVLKELGVIKNKYNMHRSNLMRQRKEAATWLKEIDAELAKVS